jgi:hypothetical protein
VHLEYVQEGYAQPLSKASELHWLKMRPTRCNDFILSLCVALRCTHCAAMIHNAPNWIVDFEAYNRVGSDVRLSHCCNWLSMSISSVYKHPTLQSSVCLFLFLFSSQRERRRCHSRSFFHIVKRSGHIFHPTLAPCASFCIFQPCSRASITKRRPTR